MFYLENKRMDPVSVRLDLILAKGFYLPMPQPEWEVPPNREKVVWSILHLKSPRMVGETGVGSLKCTTNQGDDDQVLLHDVKEVELSDPQRTSFAGIRIVMRARSQTFHLVEQGVE